MQLFAGNAGSSLNYGYVNDPHYNSTLNKLYQMPTRRAWPASGRRLTSTRSARPTTRCIGHES